MIKRIQSGARMSGAVVHGNTVYTAGQVADDTSQGVGGQTQQILAKIDALLAEAGTDKSKLLSTNIWLTDMATFHEMNKVWDAWVSPGNAPAIWMRKPSRRATPSPFAPMASIVTVSDMIGILASGQARWDGITPDWAAR